MLTFLSFLFFTQAFPPAPLPTTPQEIVQSHTVRPLPGKLDRVPVFNSNSPELVLNEGILLSTFPKQNKSHPNAHLNYSFEGRFDIFAHHVAKAPTPEDLRTLYLGILLHNPSQKTVTITTMQGASYLSQPDAPFIRLPSVLENRIGEVYAGPGSRVMSEILRGKRQEQFPAQVAIPPGESYLMLNAPIPVKDLEPPLNGRSTYLRLHSDGKVYGASLAMFAPTDEAGRERKPTLAEWEEILDSGSLVTPRDRPPAPPNNKTGGLIYGRVAGVSQGSQWQATLTDSSDSQVLTIPESGKAFSYGISTLVGGTYGTKQIQSAPMLVRYPDTAYAAHGNYGVQYSLNLPLINPTQETRNVTLSLQTPIKQDRLVGGIRFLEPHAPQVFFRGTLGLSYENEQGEKQDRYFHLVQHRGERGQPLVTLQLLPGQQRSIQVDLLYPPDATPPQVLTVSTEEK